MSDETTTQNQNPAQEDKATIKTELLEEAVRNDKLVEEATSPLRDKIAALEQELVAKAADTEELKGQLAKLQADFDGASAAYAYAVEDFRALALQANPFITPELVGGDTVEAVKANVAKANALVAKVKQSLEQQAATLTHLANVPAGAPGRSEPDLSALSAVEKINLGLEQAKRKK
jgi:chromosome segregation ATPase